MSTTPVLALPDFSKQFIVETDASDQGLSAILKQGGIPIAFLSKPLGSTNRFLSIYEKEFLALIMAVERWRPYLMRQEFLIRTYHKSLAYLGNQNLHSELQRKAMTRLTGLHFKIQYKKGKENVVAYALSRMPSMMRTQSYSEVQPQWVQEVINSYATDGFAQQLLAQLDISSPDVQGYSLHQVIIRWGSQIWVGANSALQTKQIKAFNSTTVGGHSGIHATYQRLKKLFMWRGMKQDVDSFVKQCPI
jgi:hypothetical protein